MPGNQILGSHLLNDLELPEPEPAPEPTTTARTAVQAQAVAASPEPQPTGNGVARLEDIVETVRSRSDHEALLSAVIAKAQSAEAAEPLRAWVGTNADQLVGTMSSIERRALHALLGLGDDERSDLDTWASLLPDRDADAVIFRDTEPSDAEADGPDAERDDVTQLANQLLLETLIPEFATADAVKLGKLPALVGKVASWAAVPAADIDATVAGVLDTIGWSGAETETP